MEPRPLRYYQYFNSRPRKEVDVMDTNRDTVEAVFQLTTSQGGRPNLAFWRGIRKLFQLTTSQGGRQKLR